MLDTSAATALGYRPVGSYAETVIEQIEWLVAETCGRPDRRFDDPFFAQFTDYSVEDEVLATRGPGRRTVSPNGAATTAE